MDWFKTAAVGVGCGAAAGCLYLAAGLGTPGALVLVYMTQLPLFVAGLWLGSGTAAISGVTGVAVLFAASDLLDAAVFAAMNALPVAVVVRQALLARHPGDGAVEWYPPGLLAGWLTALALAGIAASLLLFGGPGGLQATLRSIIADTLTRLAVPDAANHAAFVNRLAEIIPGIVAASWMATMIANGALAQGLLARFGANWRPSPDLARLALPRWVLAALGLAAAATLFAGAPRFIGINAIIALLVPFCLAGLAVLHAAARRLAQPAMALVSFYAIAALFGWPFIAVAVLGLLENWLELRRRLLPTS